MTREYWDGRERPKSKMIAKLDVQHAQAKIAAVTDMISEVEARLEIVGTTKMESLTHEECVTDSGQVEALKVKLHRPQVEYEALKQYRRLLFGMQMEYADEEMEASLHLEDLTA